MAQIIQHVWFSVNILISPNQCIRKHGPVFCRFSSAQPKKKFEVIEISDFCFVNENIVMQPNTSRRNFIFQLRDFPHFIVMFALKKAAEQEGSDKKKCDNF